MPNTAKLDFIGQVQPGNAQDPRFVLQLQPQLAQGLRGLNGFSHAVVLWWAHQADSAAEREALLYRKPYRHNPDDVGVFGSRSPSRPNPIGMSVVALAEVDDVNAAIYTYFIDTEPGTPIVDIKPYFPASDRVASAATPKWCQHWPQNVEASADFDWSAEFE